MVSLESQDIFIRVHASLLKGVRDPPIQGFDTDSIKIKAFNFSTVLKFPFLALDPVAAFASQPQSSTEHRPIIDMLLHTCFLHFHSSPLRMG
ncbi:hypothetical protein OSB04_011307 [Centaurea solstitialis]|uniref:Uncharacterized protein n=1 Tax=Centaurea solstitialis TaxID=347529 RepID=A0AA38T964_9ASTR|nr:hypothetical protein OSB04_011307 [Centaurea solstitialis]